MQETAFWCRAPASVHGAGEMEWMAAAVERCRVDGSILVQLDDMALRGNLNVTDAARRRCALEVRGKGVKKEKKKRMD